ncbi:MAG: dihydroorotate dehydrogenase [Termitinemataceae bacterium]|nr:MAG: dihydroorotate dehydrogenase [Termitinemataceae bacterium]
MADVDTSVCIAGVRFRNPVIAASGTFGFGSVYEPFIEVGSLGGICTKGLTLLPKTGNEGERIWETPSGLLNSIGLENPGIEIFIERELPKMKALGPVIIANLGGDSIEEYVEGAKLLSASCIDMLELNISCPNVKSGGMAFGLLPDCASMVTSAVRNVCEKPLIVKLSPNAPSLVEVASACAASGADALSLVNTFKAMAIDVENRRPVFKNISAGLSGPAIRPIALRMVWDVCRAVNIPVIGIGGIDSVYAALEFLLAGAAAVQVGSATFSHPNTMHEIIAGIEEYMRNKNFSRISDLKISC